MIDDADTSLATILTQMGLLSSADRESLDYLVEAPNGESSFTQDARLAAYLVNNEKLTSQQIDLAEQLQRKLRSPDLMEQTQAMGAITRVRSETLRQQIGENKRLADAVLRSTSETQKKGTTSENVAVGFLVAAKARR